MEYWDDVVAVTLTLIAVSLSGLLGFAVGLLTGRAWRWKAPPPRAQECLALPDAGKTVLDLAPVRRPIKVRR